MAGTATSKASGLTSDQLELLRLLAEEEGVAPGGAPPIAPRPRKDRAPLSFAQQRLWFLCQLDPANPAYNLPSALHLEGRVRLIVLRRACAEVVRRHEALRTVFRMEDGESFQVILDPPALPLPLVDLSGLSEPSRGAEVRRLASREAVRPFDLEAGPVLRVSMLRESAERHVVLLTVHHIVSDLWSSGILIKDLSETYQALVEGGECRLPDLPIQYGDFAAWQRRHLTPELLARELEYWRDQLAGLPKLDLPADRPRPATRTYSGSDQAFSLPPPLVTELKALSRSSGSSLFALLLAAFGVVLGRYAGSDDVAIGTPVANRSRVETEVLIGFFVNTLVIRVDLAGGPTFLDLLERVRTVTLEALAHQEIPFEALVEAVEPERDLGRSPLFQVMLAFQKVPARGFRLPGGLRLRPLERSRHTAKFDLTMYLTDTGPGLEGTTEYNTDLFDGSTVRRFLKRFEIVLAAAAENAQVRVADIDLLAGSERHQVLLEWNDTEEREWPRASVLEAFEAQVRTRPDAVALGFERIQLTYRELAWRARALARRLAGHGVGPDVPVAVLTDRSPGLVIALLAALESGGAYVPLDPEYPPRRLEQMLATAGAPVVLCSERWASVLPADFPVARLDPDVESVGATGGGAIPGRTPDGDQLAYVIFTSGSTGRPKGAMNTHRAIANRLCWMGDAYGVSPQDAVLHKTPFSFDVSVWELFLPLMRGARLEVARPGGHRDPAYLARTLRDRRIALVHFVPSMLKPFLDVAQEGDLVSLRHLVTSGEALPQAAVEHFARLSGAGLENLYGPTEAAVDVTYHSCGPRDRERAVPIGRPIANLRVVVVDSAFRAVPVGVPGELLIRGVGLARGYVGAPTTTAQAFVPDAWGEQGARAYRTGDLARLLPDGEIDFLGRIDHQVKIRGFRIELGEVESALATHPRVKEAAAAVRGGGEGPARLVAYVVPDAGEAPTVDELRAFLADRLPPYMVPSLLVSLEALPATPSGKLDRRALGDPTGDRFDLEQEYVPPATPTEEVLAGIWSRVLGVERVGSRDDFFALGGDSILSLQVLSLAKDRGLDLDLPQIFRHPTVAGLAAVVDAGRVEAPAVPLGPFALIEEEDRRRLPDGVVDAYPMTRLQLGMLYHMELAPDHPLFHNVNSFELEIPFDPQTLQVAVDRVVARHPILRTSFHSTGFGEPLQLVNAEARLPVAVVDLRSRSAPERDAEIERFFDAQEKEPFELDRPPLIRFHVHRLTDDVFRFTLTEAHAIGDGWSLHSTLTEVFGLYMALLRGEEPEEPPQLRCSFRDYVGLERAALESPDSRRYWEEALRGYTPAVVPPWPSRARGGGGERRIEKLETPVPEELQDGLLRVARAAVVPLKSVLLAVHLRVIGLLTGRDDVVTGLLTNGRPEQPDGDRVRGLFLNVVPLRLPAAEGSWLDVIRRVFDAERELLAHRRFPLAEIQRGFGRRRLVETEFNYIHFHVVGGLLQDDHFRVLGAGGRSEQTDMSMTTTFGRSPVDDRLYIGLRHDTSKIGSVQARWIGAAYLALLEAVARRPEGDARALLPLPPAVRQQLLVEWNDTCAPRPAEALHDLFEERVRRAPDAVAAVAGRRALTFRELGRRARSLAARLHRAGLVPGDRIALLFGAPSPESAIAMLASSLAGGTFVALDPEDSPARLERLVARCQPRVVLADPAVAPPAGAQGRVLTVPPEADPDPGTEPLPAAAAAAPAYVAFTSGSSGDAKGIVTGHRNVANYLRWLRREISSEEGETVLQVASLQFDASVRDVLGAMVAGARVAFAAPGEDRQPSSLLARADRHRATAILGIVPSLLRQLPGSSDTPLGGTVRRVLVSGEPLDGSLCRRLRELFGAGIGILNLYGPTECTMTSTAHPVPLGIGRDEPVPLGRPIDNVRVRVLSRRLEAVPRGSLGEVCIAGAGVTSGYLDAPALTAASFVPDPHAPEPGARLYRSGDLGRFLPDGSLEFHGRMDRQVKLRGVRVELAGVEAALQRHPALREVAVAVRSAGDDERLIAYLVPVEAPAPGVAEMRRFLAASSFGGPVPEVWAELDSLPRLPSGKVDHGALPTPAGVRPSLEELYVAPRTAVEEALASLWRELLVLDVVGVHDDFFELGGHSLLAMRLISRVREVFHVALPLGKLFLEPTVAGLAAAVEDERRAWREGAPDPILAGAGSEAELRQSVDALSAQEVDELLAELMEEEEAGGHD